MGTLEPTKAAILRRFAPQDTAPLRTFPEPEGRRIACLKQAVLHCVQDTLLLTAYCLLLTLIPVASHAATCNDNANGNWAAAGTWTGCGGGFPGSSDDVIIDSHTVTLAANANARDVTISGGTLNLSSYTLNVARNWSRTSGTFTPSTGTVVFSGSGAKTLTSGGQAFNNLTINDGLIGYWKLDETVAGSAVADSSGYGNDGTLSGTPVPSTTVAPLLFNSPRSIDIKVTDQVVIPLITTATTNLTMSAWIYQRTDTGAGIIFFNGSGSDGYGLMIGDCSCGIGSKICVLLNFVSCGAVSSLSAISTGQWYHVALTRDSSTWTLYVNGVAQGTSTSNPVAPTGTANLGDGDDIWSFDGYMDDVRFYNRALSAAEIGTLYAGYPPGVGVSGSSLTLQDALDVNGNLVIASGNLDVKSGSNYAINVAGSWINSGGTFNARSGTVTFDGTSGTNKIQSGGQMFNLLTVSGAGGTWQMDEDAGVADDLTVSAGTLNLNGFDVAVGDNVTASAGLNLGTGRLEANGSVNLTGSTLTQSTGTLILSPDTAGETLTAAGKSLSSLMVAGNDGLIGYWKLDETSANTCSGGTNDACDSSVSAKDGAYAGNTAAATACPFLNFTDPACVTMDGSGDYIDVGNQAVYEFGYTDARTFSAWLKPRVRDTWSRKFLMKSNPLSPFNGWNIGVYDGSVSIEYINSTAADNYFICGTSSSGLVPPNMWTHVAVVYNNKTCKVYINGSSAATSISHNTISADGTSTASLIIGNTFPSSNNDWYGEIDDVRIYNRELNSTEVALLATGLPVNTAGTVTLQDTLDLDRDLILYHGKLAAGSNTINVGRNWTNDSAVFTAGTGRVVFDDDSQNNAITGTNTFYNLEISTSTAKSVTFESGKTQTIASGGSLLLQGGPGAVLTLGPATAASAWLLAFNGATATVQKSSVSYSDASGGSKIQAGDGTNTDGGNNTNWCFSYYCSNASNAAWFSEQF